MHFQIHTWWNMPVMLLKLHGLHQSDTMLHKGHFTKVHIIHSKYTGAAIRAKNIATLQFVSQNMPFSAAESLAMFYQQQFPD